MSSAQFVEMYHPLLPETVTDPVLVSLSSVDDHAAHGWLLVDPDEVLPAPATPYYTRGAADSRFGKVAGPNAWTGTQDFTGATVTGIAGGDIVADATTTAKGVVELATTTEAVAGTDGTRAVTPAGLKAAVDAQPTVPNTLVYRVLWNGTAYNARPGGVLAGYAEYVGPTEPTTWLDGDTWIERA